MNKMIAISLPPAQGQWLKIHCKATGRKVSSLISMLVENYQDEVKAEKEASAHFEKVLEKRGL